MTVWPWNSRTHRLCLCVIRLILSVQSGCWHSSITSSFTRRAFSTGFLSSVKRSLKISWFVYSDLRRQFVCLRLRSAVIIHWWSWCSFRTKSGASFFWQTINCYTWIIYCAKFEQYIVINEGIYLSLLSLFQLKTVYWLLLIGVDLINVWNL